MKLSKESLPLSQRLEIQSEEYMTTAFESLIDLQEAIDRGDRLKSEQLGEVCLLLEAFSSTAYEMLEVLKREVWLEAAKTCLGGVSANE